MRQKGHIIFENDSRDFNLNIIGIRSKTAKLDEFGCQLMVAWKYHGQWKDCSFRITTYPGRRYMVQKLLNPMGCAILAEGQYVSAYKRDYHRGKYLALCQRRDVVVYRDRDKDEQFDLEERTKMMGLYGINIHNSPDGMTTTRVGAHSAGCQVFSDDEEYKKFMNLINRAVENHGNSFTYTLINE